MRNVKIAQSIPIIEHLKFKGIKVTHVADKSFAHRFEKEIKLLFTRHKKEFKGFKRYVYEHSKLGHPKKFQNVAPVIRKMGLSNLKKYQSFITGSLYEFYVYLLLKDLDIDDIEVGVSVEEYYNETDYLPNEFDILIMKNNHLHMIECKFTKNVRPEHLVYKYIALSSVLDEDANMAILLNQKYKKHIDYEHILRDLPYKRALQKDIMLRGSVLGSENLFVQEIKKHFGI
jgi:hypothetical protein